MPRPRTIMIGRHSDCDVVLPHETVSRFHAELVVTESGRFFLIDRNSTRGTWRSTEGGRFERLKQADYVNAEDRIRFGESEPRVVRDIAQAG